MTRRKRTKAPKPTLCPACATELPDAFIRSSANSLAGRKDRPGAVGLVRNPTGSRERVEKAAEYSGITLDRIRLYAANSRWFSNAGRTEMAAHWARESAHLAFTLHPELRDNDGRTWK